MSDSDAIVLGESVDRLTKEPAFQHAIVAIKGEILAELEGSNFLQKRKREHCYRMLKTINLFEKKLKAAMRRAKEAEKRER